MGLISGVWMLLLGILAAPNIIISKRPDAKEVIDKIAPYQGWIGAVSAIFGLWGVLYSIFHIRWLFHIPIYWLTLTATGILQLSLGLLLGIGVIKSFLKQPQAVEKLDLTVAKIMPFQGKLGLAAIVMGIWMIISSLLWRPTLII